MSDFDNDPWGVNRHLKPPIPTRVTKCSTCGASIHFPLEPVYEGDKQIAAVYTCQCLPRDMKDLDPVIRLYNTGIQVN